MTVIVFDAAGTLLDVEGSVGEVYAEAARAAGAEIDPKAIERGFAQAMAAAPPLAFGPLEPNALHAAERDWWSTVAREALERAGPAPGAFRFEDFFDRVYARFSEPSAWHVHEDVRPTLRALRKRGLALAVLSNWDSRLIGLLAAIGIAGYFARIFVSSILGKAKPDPAAFTRTAREMGDLLGRDSPIMVGDRIDHDIEPAITAGWGAMRIDRPGRGGDAPRGVVTLRSLRDLLDALTSRDREEMVAEVLDSAPRGRFS